jgi:membrane associated rhomboid family serine protease
MEVPAAVWYAVLATGIVVSLLGVALLSRPGGRWGQIARKRLLLGLPWGTLVAVVCVAGFYLFVQDGLAAPRNPLVVPFRAWGYFYPTGMLTAAFAHSGLGHVTSNLLGTLVFGSLAEYAWSHFPRQRGSSSFSSALTNPFVRIGIWALGIFVAGILSAMFALGPVIGFSGVVFAFVGLALVRFPLAVIAAVLVGRVVNLVYSAIRLPTVQQTASETFSRPWWADIAIQGHALGLFIGIVAGVALVCRRGVRPNPGHVWLAALVFAVDRGLWAVYTIEGSDTFRLFQALGTALVFLVSALVASGVAASTRDLVSRIDLSRREAAHGLLLAILLALALSAVPFNLFVVDDPSTGLEDADPVEVRDYTVFYTEDVENQFIPAVPIPGQNASERRVNASGVIIVSERRNIWWEEVSAGRLASRGGATIRLGGLGWSRDVRATRTTWNVAGGESTHRVRLGEADSEVRPVVFRAERARADARIDGRNISIEPVDDEFEIVVTRHNETLDRAAIPPDENTTTAAGVTFEREGRNLFAERGETRVRVAQRAHNG